MLFVSRRKRSICAKRTVAFVFPALRDRANDLKRVASNGIASNGTLFVVSEWGLFKQ